MANHFELQGRRELFSLEYSWGGAELSGPLPHNGRFEHPF